MVALCDQYIRLTEDTGDSKPKNRKATYCSIQVKDKMGEDGIIKYRVRLTVEATVSNFMAIASRPQLAKTLKMLNGQEFVKGEKRKKE